MYGARHDQRMTWFQSFACGGIAGIVSRTATSPLEVVKVLAQVGTVYTKQGLVNTFSNVYRNEGVKAFWKGNWITCLRLFPYSALQILAFNSIVTSVENLHEGHSSVFAGLGSTAFAMLVVYPCDVIRTRLIVQPVQPSLAKYHGIRHAFKTIWKEEGLLALYRGLLPSVFGVIPFAGGSYLAYRLLDDFTVNFSEVHILISGCGAAAFAQTLSYPFDTVRKKMQASRNYMETGVRGNQVKYSGMSEVFTQTIKFHGIQGLWRGLTVNLLKIVPNIGLTYLLFEHCRKVFLFYNGYTTSPWESIPRDDIDQSLLPHEIKMQQTFLKDNR